MMHSNSKGILRRRALVASLTLAAVPAVLALDAGLSTGGGAAFAAADPVISIAGDIACATSTSGYNGGEGTATQCRQKHTSDMILNADYVLVLGDAQYPSGGLAQYRTVYDATWGRKKSVTFPAPGDHDYQSSSTAAGYFAYFGVPSYYSFDIGSWHFASLNSEIDHSAGSPQEQWLKADLSKTSQPCVGAFWGAATFSSGGHGNNTSFRPFWDDLYAAKADVVLGGDDHEYERFTKLTPAGTPASDGIRQFVVGTGGRNLSSFKTIQPTSQAHAKVFGVLDMRLGASDYSWQFRTESGGTFSDSGTEMCNAKPSAQPSATTAPSATESASRTATASPSPSATATSSAPLCLGLPATIVGTSGADQITGTDGPDVINALGGNDIVNGGGGDDVICGAGGQDQIDGGAGNDHVNGGAAADTLTDSAGTDVLDGSTGNDSVNVVDGLAGDAAYGGSDTDSCKIDSGDTVRSCETVG
jgi:Ca2+-binding RTX toxin-like protein